MMCTTQREDDSETYCQPAGTNSDSFDKEAIKEAIKNSGKKYLAIGPKK